MQSPVDMSAPLLTGNLVKALLSKKVLTAFLASKESEQISYAGYLQALQLACTLAEELREAQIDQVTLLCERLSKEMPVRNAVTYQEIISDCIASGELKIFSTNWLSFIHRHRIVLSGEGLADVKNFIRFGGMFEAVISPDSLGKLIVGEIQEYGRNYMEQYMQALRQYMANIRGSVLAPVFDLVSAYVPNKLTLYLMAALKKDDDILHRYVAFLQKEKEYLDFNITDSEGDTLATVLMRHQYYLKVTLPITDYIDMDRYTNLSARTTNAETVFSLMIKYNGNNEGWFVALIKKYNRMRKTLQISDEFALANAPCSSTVKALKTKFTNRYKRITHLTIVKFLVSCNASNAEELFEDALVTGNTASYHYLRREAKQTISEAMFHKIQVLPDEEVIHDFLQDNPQSTPRDLLARAIAANCYPSLLATKLFSLGVPLDSLEESVRAKIACNCLVGGLPDVVTTQILQNNAFTDQFISATGTRNFSLEMINTMLAHRPKFDNFYAKILVRHVLNVPYWQQKEREGRPVYLQDIVEHLRRFHQKTFLSTFVTRRYSGEATLKELRLRYVDIDAENILHDSKIMKATLAQSAMSLMCNHYTLPGIKQLLDDAVINDTPHKPSCTADLIKKFNTLDWNVPITLTSRFRTFKPLSLKQYVDGMRKTNHEKYITLCHAADEDGLKTAVGKHRRCFGSFFGKTRGSQLVEEVMAMRKLP